MQGLTQAQPTTTIVIQAPQQQQLIQQQHQQQQQIQENEQFALSWLRSNYEHAAGTTLDQTEMYHQYISSCAKIGRRGVVTSYHFPRFVRYGAKALSTNMRSCTNTIPCFIHTGLYLEVRLGQIRSRRQPLERAQSFNTSESRCERVVCPLFLPVPV